MSNSKPFGWFVGKMGLMPALLTLDHPANKAGAVEEVHLEDMEVLKVLERMSIPDWQAWCSQARELLVEQQLLDAYREAIFPLADINGSTPDCRECRQLNNLFVPLGDRPNPEWVGAVA